MILDNKCNSVSEFGVFADNYDDALFHANVCVYILSEHTVTIICIFL